MKTVKAYKIIFDCKTKTEKIEEVEITLPENIPKLPLQPSPIETVLYHVCKMLESNKMSDNVIKEYITQYENTYK